MADLPPGMLLHPPGQRERHVDPRFVDGEYLYRRVPDIHWDEEGGKPFEVAAIAMPDMSVGRSKYAHPEWLRLAEDDFALWGIIGVSVGEIPDQEYDNGIRYKFQPMHKPERRNYPHSEICAFRESPGKELQHVRTEADLPDDMYLAWREVVHRRATVFLYRGQAWKTRLADPVSHIPEGVPAEKWAKERDTQ